MTGEISQRSHNMRQQMEGQSDNINSLFIYYNLDLLQPVYWHEQVAEFKEIVIN